MKIKHLEISLVILLALACLLVYSFIGYSWMMKRQVGLLPIFDAPVPTLSVLTTAAVASVLPPSSSTPTQITLQGEETAPARSGSLSIFQQRQLQISAQKHLAATPQDALKMAKTLDFVGQQGHPSNMCGPLAISILRGAGLLPADTPLDKFWLLNPREYAYQQLLDQYFPPQRFEHLRITTPIHEIDWQAQPLLPGDFVYLYAGVGGNFEHMLVITRADGFGRVFSVTNYATPQGFVIQEEMLYDPLSPASGLFYEWTRKPYAKLGATGFGGLEVWRLRQGP